MTKHLTPPHKTSVSTKSRHHFPTAFDLHPSSGQNQQNLKPGPMHVVVASGQGQSLFSVTLHIHSLLSASQTKDLLSHCQGLGGKRCPTHPNNCILFDWTPDGKLSTDVLTWLLDHKMIAVWSETQDISPNAMMSKFAKTLFLCDGNSVWERTDISWIEHNTRKTAGSQALKKLDVLFENMTTKNTTTRPKDEHEAMLLKRSSKTR